MTINNRMYQSNASNGCSCSCHNYPNNLAGCMDCVCKPLYGLNNNQKDKNDILLAKIEVMELLITNLNKTLNELLQYSDSIKCPTCNAYSDWHHIGL